MDSYEIGCQRWGYRHIAGVDEVGRGALAGPVIAAAVILPVNCPIDGLKDSKQLTPGRREELALRIRKGAVSVAIGTADAGTVDRLNVLNAALFAMRMAIEKLVLRPDYVLVDGPNLPDVAIRGVAIPKGDNLSYTIAAASIIAKTTRDKLMVEFDRRYPGYGFKQHKGYPTPRHRQAISRLGACEIHRRSFRLLPDD